MNFIKNTFERKCKVNLLFTDIDILVCEIETEDVYESFMKIKVYYILVTIQKIQNFLIKSIKK